MRWTLYVGRDPGHALVAAIPEINDAGEQQQLEVPRDGLALLLGQDGATGRALTFLAQVLVLDERVALLAPRHQSDFLTCRPRGRVTSSASRRGRTSRAALALCSADTSAAVAHWRRG